MIILFQLTQHQHIFCIDRNRSCIFWRGLQYHTDCLTHTSQFLFFGQFEILKKISCKSVNCYICRSFGSPFALPQHTVREFFSKKFNFLCLQFLKQLVLHEPHIRCYPFPYLLTPPSCNLVYGDAKRMLIGFLSFHVYTLQRIICHYGQCKRVAAQSTCVRHPNTRIWRPTFRYKLITFISTSSKSAEKVSSQ